MPRGTRWRPQPTMGSEARTAQTRPELPTTVDLHPLDWNAIVIARHNVLISGVPSAVDAMLSAVWPHLRRPICQWPPDGAAGTLILENVAAHRKAKQHALLKWLDDTAGRVQVVSTTTQSLFPLVERDVFRADLYYRLNTVFLDLRDPRL